MDYTYSCLGECAYIARQWGRRELLECLIQCQDSFLQRRFNCKFGLSDHGLDFLRRRDLSKLLVCEDEEYGIIVITRGSEAARLFSASDRQALTIHEKYQVSVRREVELSTSAVVETIREPAGAARSRRDDQEDLARLYRQFFPREEDGGRDRSVERSAAGIKQASLLRPNWERVWLRGQHGFIPESIVGKLQVL